MTNYHENSYKEECKQKTSIFRGMYRKYKDYKMQDSTKAKLIFVSCITLLLLIMVFAARNDYLINVRRQNDLLLAASRHFSVPARHISCTQTDAITRRNITWFPCRTIKNDAVVTIYCTYELNACVTRMP